MPLPDGCENRTEPYIPDNQLITGADRIRNPRIYGTKIYKDGSKAITGIALQYYGKIIYDFVLINEYKTLREHFLVERSRYYDFDNLVTLDSICNTFLSTHPPMIITLAYISKAEKIINMAFKAYMVWMSQNRFTYNMEQAPHPDYGRDEERHNRAANGRYVKSVFDYGYEIFYVPKSPRGNCTQVNNGFLFLLQTLGIHPESFNLISVSTNPDSGAYVITKPDEEVRVLLRDGSINNEFAQFLKLPAYVSKSVKLRPNSCEVMATHYETPFPNHQYVSISFLLRLNYYDARCGFRYSDSMGMYEFWTTKAKVKYWALFDGKLEPMLAEIVGGDNANNFTIKAPELCHRSILRLTRGEDNGQAAVGWFPVKGNETYGVCDTWVQLENGTERQLPYTLACVYGYFIKDRGTKYLLDLHEKIKTVLSTYEGRSSMSFRKPSPESREGLRLLRSHIGGEVSEEKLIKYYGGSQPETGIKTGHELGYTVYALLGTIEYNHINPLKPTSTLFSLLAEAVAMPTFLKVSTHIIAPRRLADLRINRQ